jgi:hypothetical protein
MVATRSAGRSVELQHVNLLNVINIIRDYQGFRLCIYNPIVTS